MKKRSPEELEKEIIAKYESPEPDLNSLTIVLPSLRLNEKQFNSLNLSAREEGLSRPDFLRWFLDNSHEIRALWKKRGAKK